jgi:ectoine hydroxylase-related dioxygenase (phytanoyl-CoA dioxygenase family)
MNEALRTYGVVILRQLFSPADMSALRTIAENAYAAVDSNKATGDVIEKVHAWGGMNVLFLSNAGISEEQITAVLDLITTCAATELGSCRLVPEISLFRRHTEIRTHIPWHIDADGAGTRDYDPCFNVWIPLVAVGRDRPSLEIVRGSHTTMRDLPLLGGDVRSRSEEWVNKHFPRPARMVAELESGDVLIFDHYVLHRTQPMATQAYPRTSGEFRVQLQDHLIPSDQGTV